MREIKFRAWDKDEGKLSNVEAIDWKGGEARLNDNREDWVFLSLLELMQFTGLKDINGKDIYEGDIVRDAKVANSRGYEIKWHNETEDGGDYVNYSTGYYLPRLSDELEIIGNIFAK